MSAHLRPEHIQWLLEGAHNLDRGFDASVPGHPACTLQQHLSRCNGCQQALREAAARELQLVLAGSNQPNCEEQRSDEFGSEEHSWDDHSSVRARRELVAVKRSRFGSAMAHALVSCACLAIAWIPLFGSELRQLGQATYSNAPCYSTQAWCR